MSKIDELYIAKSKSAPEYDKSQYYIGKISKVNFTGGIIQTENMTVLRQRLNHVDILTPNTVGYLVVIDSAEGLFLGQRQIVFRLMDRLAEIVEHYDGSLTGCNGSGRLLTPWTRARHDKETAEVMASVKKIFDPYHILNTDVQSDKLTRNEVLAMLRQDYRQGRFTQYNLRG